MHRECNVQCLPTNHLLYLLSQGPPPSLPNSLSAHTLCTPLMKVHICSMCISKIANTPVSHSCVNTHVHTPALCVLQLVNTHTCLMCTSASMQACSVHFNVCTHLLNAPVRVDAPVLCWSSVVTNGPGRSGQVKQQWQQQHMATATYHF